MTTRTLAATAAVLPDGTSHDRRTMLASAGAAAVLAAIGAPAVAAPADPDAPLWALRTRWLDTLHAFNAAMNRCDAALNNAYALPGWPSANQRDRASLKILAGVGEAESLQDQASDANTAVVDQIAAMPARTLAGLAFKVEVSADWEHDRETLTASIMADVAAFAAAHPTVRI